MICYTGPAAVPDHGRIQAPTTELYCGLFLLLPLTFSVILFSVLYRFIYLIVTAAPANDPV